MLATAIAAASWSFGAEPRTAGGRAPADLAAAALAADPPPPVAGADGNGVFEPGESVVLAPSWRNRLASPVAATGLLSAFTGPGAPAAYSITDATADYGQIAAGATRSCLDAGGNCYGLAVAAGPRPALHWDATVFETMSNGSLKSWPIHLGRSFGDVTPESVYYRFVETLLHNQVTAGCGVYDWYCGISPATREQMAVFVLASREGRWFAPPGCVHNTEIFGDVLASSPFCPWIEELARRGVVSGCGNGRYCPFASVLRQEMAVFVLRTLEGSTYQPPACVAGSEIFNDVPASSPYCRWIEELARRSVVNGCGGGRYCPAAPVSRSEMSVFLTVTFGLSLYGPDPNAFVVNSTDDVDDGACTGTHCSLREAIAAANAMPNGARRDEIRFAIPGTGPFTLRPSAASLAESVVVDGYSQPGSRPAEPGFPPILLVELDLSQAGAMVAASDSLLRGLVLNRGNAGIRLTGQSNAVEGCLVGTDPTGRIARPNGEGIVVEPPSGRGNRIGGLTTAARNVISGNTAVGVHLMGDANRVQGNFIGTDVEGMAGLGAGAAGVHLDAGFDLGSSSQNVIDGNIIVNSSQAGVRVSATCCASVGVASDNRIQNNMIGLDVTFTPGPNGVGILMEGSSTGAPVMVNNLVGSEFPDSYVVGSNTVAHNIGDGVTILGGAGTRLAGNTIYSNGAIGVHVTGDGSTPDVATFHAGLFHFIYDNGALGIVTSASGPGDLPVLTSAQTSGNAVVVSGVVHTPVPVTVDFYASPAADPSGFGEGEVFLGSITAEPNVAFTTSLPGAVPVGWVVSATSTYPGSRTSGFSLSIPATAPLSPRRPRTLDPPR